MNIVDRYLLFLFAKIFSICLMSFTGLFIVIHLSTNLEELIEAGKVQGSVLGVLWEFYSPRALDIFNRSAGVLVLMSAIFALGLVERRREMIAIQSAGIPKSRLVKPVLIGAIVVLCLAVVNREFLIPSFKEQLVRTPQNWLDSGGVPMPFQKDPFTGILIRGDELFVKDKIITHPDIQIPFHLDAELSSLQANQATFEPEKPHHPAGLLMRKVTEPESLAKFSSIEVDGKTIVYLPKDYSWLAPDQCLLVSNLDPQEIAYGKQLMQYSSLPDMVAALRRPRQFYGHGPQIEVHARIFQPFLDLALLLIGLPLVIGRTGQNVFTSAAICLSLVVVMQVSVLASHSLGSVSLIQPAALSVWLPVLVFLPIGFLTMRRLEQ